jgi:uncharacterized protein (PEP-CTERM system associated)
MARKNKSQLRWIPGPRSGRGGHPTIYHAAAVTVLATIIAPSLAHAQNQGAQDQAAQDQPGGGLSLPPVPGEVGQPPVAGTAVGAQPELRIWLFQPRAAVEETVTDNVRLTATHRQADLITTLSPGFFLKRESPRILGTLDYSPQILRHIRASDQDTIAQNLLGNGTLNIVQDYLFLDLNASMSEQSRSGARGFGNTNEVASGDRTQQMTFAASPYARFHLGDFATSEVRYRVSQTSFSGSTGAITSSLTGQNLSALSDSTQQEGTAIFKSGRELSRLQGTLTADYYIANYTNNTLSSRRTFGSLDMSYAVTHSLYALFGGGYERLTYPHSSGLNDTGPTYSLGAKYERNEKQSITLTYGRRDGANGLAADAIYRVTPLTTVSAQYTKQRLTSQQRIAQNLLSAVPTGPGTAVNLATNLPLSITNGLQNPNVPLQNDIFLAEDAQLGLTNQSGRNSYSVVLTRTNQTSLLHLSPNQESTGGFVTWGRELSPSLNSNVVLGYSNVSPGASHVVTFSASLGYAVTQTLQAGVLYNLYVTEGGTTSGITANSLTLSVTKTF